MPDGFSFEDAASIKGGAETAWKALFTVGELEAGQTVLIHAAAGGVGQFAVQLAKWKGANVIGTASTSNRFISTKTLLLEATEELVVSKLELISTKQKTTAIPNYGNKGRLFAVIQGFWPGSQLPLHHTRACVEVLYLFSVMRTFSVALMWRELIFNVKSSKTRLSNCIFTIVGLSNTLE